MFLENSTECQVDGVRVPVPAAARVTAVGGHFVAGELFCPARQLWKTPLGIKPSSLADSLLGATWCAPPCLRQSSDDDAPDLSGSGSVRRGNGVPTKPVSLLFIAGVSVNRRHTQAPPPGPASGA